MDDRILEGMTMFLGRPWLQNDFVFISVLQAMLRKNSDHPKLLAEKLGIDIFSIMFWYEGKNFPPPNIRSLVFELIKDELATKPE